jgi:hypothetical protein
MQTAAAIRYLRLGLQARRARGGGVGADYGPAEVAAAVEAERPVDPRILGEAG